MFFCYFDEGLKTLVALTKYLTPVIVSTYFQAAANFSPTHRPKRNGTLPAVILAEECFYVRATYGHE
jgi:hypothetical protein